jgi:hypothetical protein
LTRAGSSAGPCWPPCYPPAGRERVTALLTSEPRRAWTGADLAEKLQITPHNLLTQLAEWTRLGFLVRTGAGTYSIDTPP